MITFYMSVCVVLDGSIGEEVSHWYESEVDVWLEMVMEES